MLVGMVMVMLTGGLDLSIGAIMALAGVICVYLMNTLGLADVGRHHRRHPGGCFRRRAMNGLFITPL